MNDNPDACMFCGNELEILNIDGKDKGYCGHCDFLLELPEEEED